MINIKDKVKNLIIICATLLLFSLCVIQLNENIVTTANTENNKTIYLTFDEGYETEYTENILDTLNIIAN